MIARLILRAALAAASLLAASAAFAADAAHPTVVELFQSQGCSSCPPAAANVRAISDRPDVLALAFEVDYWDRLGWKDTFSSPAWTARQYAYARAMGRDGVYTPQVVVNGRVEGDGLEASGLAALIERGDRGVGGPSAAFDGRIVTVGQGEAPAGGADVWLARYDPRVVEVEVRRGENAGRTCRTRTWCATWSSSATGTGGRRRFRFQPAAPASPRRRSCRRPAPARSWRRRSDSRNFQGRTRVTRGGVKPPTSSCKDDPVAGR